MSGLNEGDICRLFDSENHIDAISIMSVNRPNNQYIYKTLNNIIPIIGKDKPLNIYIGNTGTDYLDEDNIKNNTNDVDYNTLTINKMDSVNSLTVPGYWVHKRAAWNYARILCNYSGNKGLLLIEDDIDIHNNFLMYVDMIISDIKNKKGHKSFIISLYDRFHPHLKNADSILYAPLSLRDGFACTQCMYFTADTARDFGKHLYSTLGQKPYDLEMNEFRIKNNIPLYIIRPSLVQHEGNVSTGLGGLHYSPNYVKDSVFVNGVSDRW